MSSIFQLMKKEMWSELIKALPPGMAIQKVARMFRRSYTLTRRRLVENEYPFKRAAVYRLPRWVERSDWSLPNIQIARKFNITRERVRQFREKLGKPKVESRGRKPSK